jgi:hypothetical protein
MKKEEPTIVKVVTLLVSPPEAERLSLASHEGVLRMAMRNYNDSKIVLTSGTDVQQMLRAYSNVPDVPVMPTQPAAVHHALIGTPRRAQVEIEIMRNGKTSESVSFVNEAAADNSSSSKPSRHAHRDNGDSYHAAAEAPKSAPAEVASSSVPATAAVSGGASPVAPAPAVPAVIASAPPPLVDSEHRTAAPFSGDIPAPAAISAASDGHVPTPKTIDIP